MAKNKNQSTENTNVEQEAQTQTQGAGGKRITITLDEKHAALVGKNAGDVMNRTDYIKERYAAGTKRGDIARELTALNNGVKVPYQIVFASTKPVKAAEAPAASEGGDEALQSE